MPDNENSTLRSAAELGARIRQPNTGQSAADIHSISKDVVALVNDLKKDQELRKWCVEEAHSVEMHDINYIESLYNFVTRQLNEAVLALESESQKDGQ